MRKIEQFLPPRYRTKSIRNFMASTTNQLFSEKDAMVGSYFIGDKPSGLYLPNSDLYAPEIRKVREDYQLAPAFIRRTDELEVGDAIFYEDIINVLKEYGCDTTNHSLLFNDTLYSYAPPINPDMFINFNDYYWYPEGVEPLAVNLNIEDIEGKISTSVPLTINNTALSLSNDMFIKLNDDKTYIVSGVGSVSGIKLTEFTGELELNYNSNVDTNDVMLSMPREYFVMERGAADNNAWSVCNKWIHKDSITYNIQGQTFKPDNARRAERPIICFNKDIALFNYERNFVSYVDFLIDSNTYSSDGVYLNTNTNKLVTRINGTNTSVDLVEGRYTVRQGSDVGTEYVFKDSMVTTCQSKHNTNVIPLFDMFDSSGVSIADDLKYPNSTFTGNVIFSYKLSDSGVYDSVLNKTISYKAFKESSDIEFVNGLSVDYGVGDYFYKVYSTEVENNILKFTINSTGNEPTIFVNDQELPQLVVFSDTTYVLDFSDLSTTNIGWFGRHNNIRIFTDANPAVVQPTNAFSLNNRIEVQFQDGVQYYYTNGTVTGNIIVREYDSVDYVLHDVWRETKTKPNNITQKFIIDKPNQPLKLEYNPTSTNVEVSYNGAVQPQDKITYRRDSITLDGVELGDFVEVKYSTHQYGVNSDVVRQDIPIGLSNNPYNEDIATFAYSEVFNHFISMINAQPFIKGSALSSNTYRDTIRDNTLGTKIVRHATNFPLLGYVLSDGDLNLKDAIKYTSLQYEMFKRSLIVGTEERMRNNEITVLNANAVLDDILTSINGLKTQSDSFATTNMVAAYRKFEKIEVDSSLRTMHNIVLSSNNAIYVYTTNGLALSDIDYTITQDELTGMTQFIPLTFAISDLIEIRYYTDIESTFAPSTAAKFGLSKPKKPTMYIENQLFTRPHVMIIGHDGSLSRAYTTVSDYNNNIIDPRDLVMMEFESRAYNGIESKFKAAGFVIVDYNQYRDGKFRTLPEHITSKVKEQEISIFNKWVTENYLNYTENTTYVSNNPYTYNYSMNTDLDGEPLAGNWKGIYMYYYDTVSPNLTPWEMLGFDIKPVWWDSEYGTDYSSNNYHLWGDLEEGIIRQGQRRNTTNGAYLLKSNIYRREGLSRVIPVDDTGALLNPIEIGITTEPTYEQAKRDWKFGDYSPVEFAWRSSSEYQFDAQSIIFVVDPLRYVTNTWNTLEDYSLLENPKNKQPHSYRNYATGISQWLYDFLKFKKLDANLKLNDNFQRQEVILGHKVGGYINRDDLRIFTESYNIRSTTNTTLIPSDDIYVSLYESRELGKAKYSGILIERVEDSLEVKPYVDGARYDVNDVVVNIDDNMYYQYKVTDKPKRWANATFYVEGNVVEYNGTLYVCIEDHRAKTENKPLALDTKWDIKGFITNEWTLLDSRPKSKKTRFKVTGYDVENPYFPTIKGNPIGKKKLLKTPSRSSQPILYTNWDSDIVFNTGDTFKLRNNQIITMTTKGITQHEPVSGTFVYNDNTDHMSNMLRQEILLDPLITANGKEYEIVQYGTVFNNLGSLVNFIIDYSRHLKELGFVYDTIEERRGRMNDWELMCEDVMQWASETNEVGSFITISPAAEHLKFKTTHGVPSVSRTLRDNGARLLNHKFEPIVDDFDVLRLDGVFSIKTKEPLFFCTVSTIEYEHALFINNRTIFGDVNFDPVFGNRKERLKISTTKTQSWDGRLAANGFIIVDGTIMPNFDTSASELANNSDLNYDSSMDIINKLKKHNIGFQERSYFRELEYDTTTQVEFYKGFIRQKGTYETINRFLRADNLANESNMEVYEEWAFKVGEFGGVHSNQSIEFEVERGSVVSNPSMYILEYDGFIDNNKSKFNTYYALDDTKWVKTPTRFVDGKLFETVEVRESGTVKNAGFVNWDDANFKSYNLESIDKNISDTKKVPELYENVWVARSFLNGGEWDILQLEESHINNTIFSHGKKDKCSFILNITSPVDEEAIYAFYDKEHIQTFNLKLIRGSYYIAVSLSGEVLLLNEILETIVIYRWVSLRGSNFNQVNVTLTDNTKIYIGDETDWKVVDKDNNTLYSKPTYVNTHRFNKIVAYDSKTLGIIRQLRIFDPLRGLYPTDLIKYIDYKVDYDPAYYDTSHGYSSWGMDKVGTIWWDTNTITYLDYDLSTDEYRSRYWGTMFPNSSIDIYEWVESFNLPEDENTKYVEERFYNTRLGVESTRYYYWVKNNNKIPDNSVRKASALEISNAISTSHKTNGYIAIISNHSFMVNDVDDIFQNDTIIQINYNIFNSKSPKHNEWQLYGETPKNSVVPNTIYDNMLNSLLEHDSFRKVPYDTLPLSMMYGNGVGQNWFVNPREARRIFVERINSFLSDINWWDVSLFWQYESDDDLYDSKYYSFGDWYSRGVNEDSFIPNIVTSRNDLKTLPLRHGELVKVLERNGRMPSTVNGGWTLYEYDAHDDTYIKVGQSNSVFSFNEHFINGGFSLEESQLLRQAIGIIFNTIMIAPYEEEKNKVFFALIRYIMTEQEATDWFFPTSYISVNHRALELIDKPIFQLDKEKQITDFINESKPFHTKLRTYNKIHSAPDEFIGMVVTDFDKPPFLTSENRDLIILQEKIIEKVKSNGTDTVYNLELPINSNSRVFVNGRLLGDSEYQIEGLRIIRFGIAPSVGRNLIKNIVIETIHTNHTDIMRVFRDTKYGYNNVYNAPLSTWIDTVNQKKITATFDRISMLPTMLFEDILSIIDTINSSETPLELFTKQSKVSVKPFTEIERVISNMCYDELVELVNNSQVFVGNRANYNTNFEHDNVVIMNNLEVIPPHLYKTKMTNNKLSFKFSFNVKSDAVISVRDKSKFEQLMKKVGSYDGITNPMHTFTVEESLPLGVELNGNNNIVVETVESNFTDLDTNTINQGGFIEPTLVGVPEEYTGYNFKESIIMTSNNNFNLVHAGYDGITGVETFAPISYVQSGNNASVPITLNVHPEQLLVMVDSEEWSIGLQYTVTNDRLNFIRVPRNGQRVVISDRTNSFDSYPDYITNNHTNLNIGGFDGNVVLPDHLNDKQDRREFIVYSAGNTYMFEEVYSHTVSSDIEIDTATLEVDGIEDDHGLYGIYANSVELVDGKYKVTDSVYEIVSAQVSNGVVTLTQRGLFNGVTIQAKSSKYNIRIMKLTCSNEMPSMTIVEPYIGNHRSHYPKYGHIVVGKDNLGE